MNVDHDEDIADGPQHRRAVRTLRAYGSDWADFEGWCESIGARTMPAAADILCLYLADRSKTCKLSTLRRRLAAITHAHRAAGEVSPAKSPVVDAVWRGIQRAKAVPPSRKRPALPGLVRQMAEAQPDSLVGTRNRAILLLGGAAGLSRSELVGLDWEDVELRSDGVLLRLPRKRMAGAAISHTLLVLHSAGETGLCPVCALKDWREGACMESGAVFRAVNRHGQVGQVRLSDRSVSLVVKSAAAAIGLDPGGFSAHSLRSGLTEALRLGEPMSQAVVLGEAQPGQAVSQRGY